jgi:hypothetical protein
MRLDYHKLVRDGILHIIEADSGQPVTRVLDQAGLRAKLMEGAEEAQAASDRQSRSETGGRTGSSADAGCCSRYELGGCRSGGGPQAGRAQRLRYADLPRIRQPRGIVDKTFSPSPRLTVMMSARCWSGHEVTFGTGAGGGLEIAGWYQVDLGADHSGIRQPTDASSGAELDRPEKT